MTIIMTLAQYNMTEMFPVAESSSWYRLQKQSAKYITSFFLLLAGTIHNI